MIDRIAWEFLSFDRKSDELEGFPEKYENTRCRFAERDREPSRILPSPQTQVTLDSKNLQAENLFRIYQNFKVVTISGYVILLAEMG